MSEFQTNNTDILIYESGDSTDRLTWEIDIEWYNPHGNNPNGIDNRVKELQEQYGKDWRLIFAGRINKEYKYEPDEIVITLKRKL